MQRRDDDLIGLRVETVMGDRVGTLSGFIMDTETGFVVQYRVRPRGFLAACFPGLRELLIAHAQVVSIDAQRMVVRDGAVRDTDGRMRKRIAPSMSPQPLTRQDGA
ncbi:PRC-barrel domain-containing protein [Candidatus Uhrbacteria bacterium]|nr:PRC-barrel domain-containing protein [Candidatus Uhrbacteria bacterium]